MIRADLIQVFKILNNIDRVNKDHSLKLYKSRLNLDIGKFAFFLIGCVIIGTVYQNIL